MNRLLLVCAVACAAIPVLAQQNIVLHGDPSTTGGTPNAFPFGKEGVRQQQIVPNSVLGMTPRFIQDLYVNPHQTYANIDSSQVYYGDIEIRMGVTQQTSLTTDWAANTPNPTSVYRGPLLVRFDMNSWTPLGLPASYLWLPQSTNDNLFLDITIWDVIDPGAISIGQYFLQLRRNASSPIERAFHSVAGASVPFVDDKGIKLGFLLDDGNFVAHDGSCSGSNGQVPSIGTTPGSWPVAGVPFDVSLQNATPNSLATLAISSQTGSYLGIPLPFDLQPFGATGCMLWHGWEYIHTPVITDASGTASSPLVFPPAFQTAARVYCSWLCLDPNANALGVVPSGYAMLTF